MSERTAREIRAYCEAASEGPWLAEIGVPYSGSLVRDKDNNFAIAQHMEAEDAQFLANARTDLLAVLDAAVKLREALLLTRGSAYDMGRYVCGRKADDVLGETEWLKEGDDGSA